MISCGAFILAYSYPITCMFDLQSYLLSVLFSLPPFFLVVFAVCLFCVWDGVCVGLALFYFFIFNLQLILGQLQSQMIHFLAWIYELQELLCSCLRENLEMSCTQETAGSLQSVYSVFLRSLSARKEEILGANSIMLF